MIALALPRRGVGVRLREHDEVFSGSFRQPSRHQRNRDRTEKIESHEYRQTAQQELSDLPNTFFDANRSGATLAWDLVHPGKHCPEMLKLVEDRDLWRHQIPNSESLLRVLDAEPYRFDR